VTAVAAWLAMRSSFFPKTHYEDLSHVRGTSTLTGHPDDECANSSENDRRYWELMVAPPEVDMQD